MDIALHVCMNCDRKALYMHLTCTKLHYIDLINQINPS